MATMKVANPLRSDDPSTSPEAEGRGTNPIPGGVEGSDNRHPDRDGDGLPDPSASGGLFSALPFMHSTLEAEDELLQMSRLETEMRMGGKSKRRKGTCCVLCSFRGTVLTALLQDGESEQPAFHHQRATTPDLPVMMYLTIRCTCNRGDVVRFIHAE